MASINTENSNTAACAVWMPALARLPSNPPKDSMLSAKSADSRRAPTSLSQPQHESGTAKEQYMTKRDQMIELLSAMEDGMCQTAQHSDIWQNRLIYALCKAVYLLLEQAVKGGKT